MSMTDIEPSSPAGRIATVLFANPKERLTRSAIAERLQIAPAAVDKAMQPGVEAGLLTVANDADIGRVWVSGRLLNEWPDAASAGIDARKAGVKRKAPTGVSRKHLPPLNMKTIQIGKVEMPPLRVNQKGKTRYDDIFDSLTADGMSATGIPADYYGALLKATQSYLQYKPALSARIRLVVRKIEDGTIGVWRVKREAVDQAQRAA